MARVNLLTIHWGGSYGGTMQTYATVKTLEELGHRVKVINLIHPKTKFSNKKSRRSSISAILYDLNMNLRFYLFRRFRIGHFTRRMYEIKGKMIPDSDYTVVGSDQVWNKDITGPLDLAYFLNFVQTGSKIAYSSSFGKFEWEGSSDYTQEVKQLLNDFKAISVREESGVKICKETFGVEALHVLDPTIVYGKYDKLIGNRKPLHSIYTFLFKNNEETRAICGTVSSEMALPIFKPNKIQSFMDACPQGWLKRMSSADFIITDSFHGLAFSIIFHKQFIVLCADEKKFARLLSLLKLIHLEDRYVQSYEDLMFRKDIIRKKIDYQDVDDILEGERQKAKSFLKKNIK